LRQAGSGQALGGAEVLPPINGGLHCGRSRTEARWAVFWRAPAYQRRAPLRPPVQHRARPGLPGVLPPINGGLHCGLPPQERPHRELGVLPPINGGLHCGALKREADAAKKAGRVLPPINGGLHCGLLCLRPSLTSWLVLPPINGGLHCGRRMTRRTRWPSASAPAYQRRAPLRQACRGAAAAPRAVLPPINGGLHCGRTTVVSGVMRCPVLPPINGGLHCGRPAGQPVHQYQRVLPPINGGLHCGSPVQVACHMTRGAPAYQRRAPLRPQVGPERRAAGGVVLPPINGGLHCG